MSMAWMKAMWLECLHINPFAVPMTSRDVHSEGLSSARNTSLDVLLVMCCSCMLRRSQFLAKERF